MNSLLQTNYKPEWKIETLNEKFNMSFKYAGIGEINNEEVYIYCATKDRKTYIVSIDGYNMMYNSIKDEDIMIGGIHIKKEIILKGI